MRCDSHWPQVRNAITQAINWLPTCQACLQDLGAFQKILEDILQYWDGPLAAWGEACSRLEVELHDRLTPPSTPKIMSLADVRFTHANINRRFKHSEHRGLDIDTLCDDILGDRVSPTDESMRLNVVWHHGSYRSINNRHFAALKNLEHCLPSWVSVPCSVLVWPLTPGLTIHGRDIVEKFYEANSSQDDGRSVSRGRSR